jgi:RHS repeat-associated protein
VTGLQSLGLVPPAPVQDLRYTYDSRLNVLSRQDWLQVSPAGVATERFDNDALDRLTCASFGTTPTGSGLVFQPGGGAAACTPQIQYAANGNIAFKSDVGHYAYDPKHKHAVLTAGSGTYAHDAVGNQIARPGATIEYTAFDLPSVVTRTVDNAAFRFDYDGDQQRIRKTTPAEETIYLDGLYERVTDVNGGVKHRYFVAAGSATLAITRVTGAPDELAYVHPDALGSVDVVTDGKGQVAERRSYDAFGARRNPKWGQALVTPSAPKVNMGFTGHEPDDELGLVNMRGRIYDPKLGRFLTTDPIVSNPLDSQSWNRYSYVRNNPLAYVDPSGFEDQPAECEGKCFRSNEGKWLKTVTTGPAQGGGTTANYKVVEVTPPSAPSSKDPPANHRDTARDDGPPSAGARRTFQDRTPVLPFFLPVPAPYIRPHQEPPAGAPVGLSALRKLNGQPGVGVANFSRDIAPGTSVQNLTLQLVSAASAAASALGAAGQLSAAVAQDARAAAGAGAGLAAPMNGELENGATVRYSATATAIGDDANTVQNFARSQGAAGHDLIVHGQALEEGGAMFSPNQLRTHTQQIADALLGNPAYQRGTPVQLVTCFGACGLARELEGIISAPVRALPGPVDLNPATGLLRLLKR